MRYNQETKPNNPCNRRITHVVKEEKIKMKKHRKSIDVIEAQFLMSREMNGHPTAKHSEQQQTRPEKETLQNTQ